MSQSHERLMLANLKFTSDDKEAMTRSGLRGGGSGGSGFSAFIRESVT